MKFINLIIILILTFLISCTTSTKDNNVKVYFNVNGYTLLDSGGLFEFDTVVFEDGKVLAVGTYDELDHYYSGATKIDGMGKTMLPGLIDAHAHIMGLGEGLLSADITGFRTKEATLEALSMFADQNPDSEWIVGGRWNHTFWPENEFPNASDIDAFISDRPVYLTRVDGHAAWVNSKALELAGITDETPDPQGGAILRDENGKATGILIDRAMGLVNSLIPGMNEQDYRRALELALENIAKMGLTGVHDAGVSVDAFNRYRDFSENGRLTTRIYGMISGAGSTFDELSAGGPYSQPDEMLTLRSVKLYSDGALGSRGAALKEDYSDDPGNRGLLFEEEDVFYNQILKVSQAGFQAGIHAIGDKANYVILNAFERANKVLGDHGLRHRIEHSQIVDVDDIPRFAEIDIIASMQPIHATSDMNMAEDRVGPVRIQGGYAWRTFLDQGTVIAAGSDFPVEPVNPFYGLYAAVSRADQDGNPEGGWYSEQSLTREEALHGFTLGAAYAGHAEERLGSLEPGKWADFILIDRDFFTVDESEIWQIQVLETWVGGQKVFDSSN